MTDLIPWPPKPIVPVYAKMREWAAWLSGDVEQLILTAPTISPDLSKGSGLVGAVARVWGTPPTRSQSGTAAKVHVPLAADIAKATPELLFGMPPKLTAAVEDEDGKANPADVVKATQKALDRYVKRGLIPTLAAAAELGAGLGSTYVRIVIDTRRGRVFTTRIDADRVIPEFEFGELVRLTIWRTLPQPAGQRGVWRHLEVHEEVDVANLDPDVELAEQQWVGVVRHELWEGSDGELGTRRPLDDHPALQDVARMIDTDGTSISTRTPGLDVVHIPNRTPNILWRGEHAGASLGLPDIQGAEPLLDQLDETYSKMFRERDLATARAIIPESWMETAGMGGGKRFDVNADLFVQVTTPPNTEFPQPTILQAQMRVTEYLAMMQQLVEDVLRHAGFSAATFGEDESGAATATEVNSKNSRTRGTRAWKITAWQPALEELLRKMIAVELAFGFAGDGVVLEPELVQVEFPQPQQAPEVLAQTIAALRGAQAISVETGVRLLHPDWELGEVAAEVGKIMAELRSSTTMIDGFEDPTAPPADAEADAAGMGPDEIRQAADAMGVLIRAGVDPVDAATRAGLSGIKFTGAVPSSLRLPTTDASTLEQA